MWNNPTADQHKQQETRLELTPEMQAVIDAARAYAKVYCINIGHIHDPVAKNFASAIVALDRPKSIGEQVRDEWSKTNRPLMASELNRAADRGAALAIEQALKTLDLKRCSHIIGPVQYTELRESIAAIAKPAEVRK